MKHVSLKKYFLKGVSGSFTLKISSVILGLGSNIILARYLGPNEYGIYAFVMSIIGLLTVPTVLGLPEYLVREISKYKVQSDWERLKGLLRRANQIVFYVSVSLTALLAFFSKFVISNEDTLKAFLVALPLLLINPLNSLRKASLQGLRHVILGQLPEFTVRPALFVSLLLIAWLSRIKFDSSQAVGLQLVCAAITFLLGAYFLIKVLPQEVKKANELYETKCWLKGALPFLFLGSMFLINNQTDIIMLGILRSSAEVGIYKVAMQGAQLVVFILMAVNVTIRPVISELYTSRQMEKLQRMLTLSVRVVVSVSLPIGLILIFFGDILIKIVFGIEYTAASYPLAVLCFGQVVNAGMGSVALVLNMTGNEQDTLKAVTTAAVVNIFLNFLLIPYFGIKGAAWATSISMICWNVISTIFVYKRLNIWAHIFHF